MLEADHVANCLLNMQNSVDIPVSIKCRLGVDNNETYEFLYNFISIVKESGVNSFYYSCKKWDFERAQS